MKSIITFVLVLCIYSLYAVTKEKEEDKTEVKPNEDKKWTDIGMFIVANLKNHSSKPVLWVSHDNPKFYVETRLSFDWSNTGGIFFGKTFSKSNTFWVTPKMGFLFAFDRETGYDGASPEINFGGSVKKFRYFFMNQVAISFHKNPSFFYQYVQMGFDWKYFSTNISFQTYQEFRNVKPAIDIGPQVLIPIPVPGYGNFYLKPWYTRSVIDQKLHKFIIGLGYHF
jgi:hypothetical protein